MRIGIDARELGKGQPGGFRSYLVGLLAGLATAGPNNDYVLYTSDDSAICRLKLPPSTRVRIVSSNRILADHIALRRLLAQDDIDVIHFPCNHGLLGLTTPMVVTLHDCIGLGPAMVCNSLRSRALAGYTAYMTRRSIYASNAILTVSDYSRREIIAHFPGVDNNVFVTHLADPLEGVAADESFSGVPKGYMLILASVDPRKNSDSVVNAFSSTTALRDGCQLVAVCSHSAARQMVENAARVCGIENNVSAIGGVTSAQLVRLYRDAAAFVFASRDEGFGLPPLEAMARGCPVIASRVASIPEVLGDAALYFDPGSIGDLADKMDALWSDADRRAALNIDGIARARLFSWRNTAEATLRVYQTASRTSNYEGSHG